MKQFYKALIIIVIGVFIFLIPYGYDLDYGFYKRSTPWMQERLETYSYLNKRFDISINSTKIDKENGRYYINFNTKLKSKSNFSYNDLAITPCLYVYLKSNNDEIDFYSIDLKKFPLFDYGKELDPNKEIEINKKLYFDDLDNNNFDATYLNLPVSKVTLLLSLSGKEIPNEINTNFPFLEEDITEQFLNISK